MFDISVIICTRNRSSALKATLESLRGVVIGERLTIELLVIDNGSTDDTAAVVQQFVSASLHVRYLREDQAGQVFARNLGLSQSIGRIIIFTDDDISFPPNWLAKMCEPIANGLGHAVAGGVKLASELVRDWMTPLHHSLLASTQYTARGNPQTMIGANMAFSRDVLKKVPAFDPELGPGRLGFWDDTLFATQLIQAGFNICDAYDNIVIHHFDPSRLLRTSWEGIAERIGRSSAYVNYHWNHARRNLKRLHLANQHIKLAIYRATHRSEQANAEGMADYEIKLIWHRASEQQYMIEDKRPFNYERLGLVKRKQ